MEEEMVLVNVAVAARYLRCCKCRGVPILPNFLQCSNGHLICPVCLFNSEKCPSCDVAFDKDAPILATGLVTFLLDKTPLKCPFKVFGCREADMTRMDLKEHIRICQFRRSLRNIPGSATTARLGSTSEPREEGSEQNAEEQEVNKEMEEAKKEVEEANKEEVAPLSGSAIEDAPSSSGNEPVASSAGSEQIHKRRRVGDESSIPKRHKLGSCRCQFCGDILCNWLSAANHIAFQHNNYGPTSASFCPFCQSTPGTRKSLFRHIRQNHQELVLEHQLP